MTKKIRSLFSVTFLLAAMIAVVGCNLDGSSTADETRAEVDAAIAAADAEQQNSNSGETTSAIPSSPAASAPSSGGGGFLWKPVSEGDGKLVVLLPSSLRGKVNGASIRKGGAVVEQGRFTGDTHNGNRPHYRFSKPGAGYGTGLTVVASLSGGSSRSWSVPNGAQRTEY